MWKFGILVPFDPFLNKIANKIYHLSQRNIFTEYGIRNGHKKQVSNKQFIPIYIWKDLCWHIWVSCFFFVFLIYKKPDDFVGNHPINISSEFGSNWFKRRRLKCKRLKMRTPTTTGVQWWQNLSWHLGSGKLIKKHFFQELQTLLNSCCSWIIIWWSLITRITWQVPPVERELPPFRSTLVHLRCFLEGIVLLDL